MTQLWVISGRVQGVGYRDWMVREARRHGIAGWVRNLPSGAVEALVNGDAAAISALHRACLAGPPLADVTAIETCAADAPQGLGFARR